jgi:hypothetical protein
MPKSLGKNNVTQMLIIHCDVLIVVTVVSRESIDGANQLFPANTPMNNSAGFVA